MRLLAADLTAYVAGSACMVEQVREVQRPARTAGFRITFDWTGPEEEINRDWSGRAAKGAEIALREIAACHCDLYVLLTPPEGRGLDCFVELGAALAYGAHCLVTRLEGRDSVFFYHPLVRVVPPEALEHTLKEVRHKMLDARLALMRVD